MSSKVKKLVISGVILALISIPLFFLWREQTAKPPATPEITPRQVTLNYTNARYNFALKFPQYWLDEEFADPIVSLTSPSLEGGAATIQLKVIEKVPEDVLKGTLEDYIIKSEENLKKDAKNYTRLGMESVKISNLPAMVLTWSMSEEKTLITKQAVFFKDDFLYILTYSSLEEVNDRFVSAFDLVTSTFRFY